MALPRPTAIWPFPGGSPTINNGSMANAIRQMGTRPKRDLLHGIGQITGSYPRIRIWATEESEVQCLVDYLRVYLER